MSGDPTIKRTIMYWNEVRWIEPTTQNRVRHNSQTWFLIVEMYNWKCINLRFYYLITLLAISILFINFYIQNSFYIAHESIYVHIWTDITHTALRYISHYNNVIMSAMASQITSLTIVYSSVYSGADQRKHQRSVSLAFVRGIHCWPMNSPRKEPVTRKSFHLLTSSWISLVLTNTILKLNLQVCDSKWIEFNVVVQAYGIDAREQ